MGYRERRLARADRLRGWSEKRAQKSVAAFGAADRLASAIPFGQPILVGHHSEKRARRDQARIHNAMSAGVQHQKMAASMDSRADEIERQAEHAIYSDDVDAIERLREKIAGLEAARERIKTINKAARSGDGWTDRIDPPLTDDERGDLLRHAKYSVSDKPGYPAYVLQNLGGQITKSRQRLQDLSGGAGPAAASRPAPDAATATARAGLTVSAGMTTPSRQGKQPRPVWTVTGNLAQWRPLLMQLGGSWYRGAFSFWEDPTAAIEAACVESEAQ